MKKHIIFLIVLVGFFITACEEDKPIPSSIDKMEIAAIDAPNLGYELTLYADDTLKSAYTALYFSVTDADGQSISGLQLTVTPIMHMPSMMHSAPVEQGNAMNPDGLYQCHTSFIMPGNDMSYWELKVQIQDPASGISDELILPIDVVAPTEARIRNFIAADDSSKLFISLVQPANPKVGINEFELAIHERATMMSFPAVADLQIEIEPEMPSMGHGSPNNEHPAHIKNGHYQGKVNFTMDGWWQVAVRIFRNEQLIGTTEFNITFQVQ